MTNRPVTRSTNRQTLPPLLAELSLALSHQLPGLSAQLQMAPVYRAEILRNRVPPPEPREAGVLVLLYPRDGQLYFPLTRRTDTVESHKGQISLPGGAREANESLQETALRETCEELSVCPDDWNVIGPLTPLYIPPSGFLISPFVAYTPMRPTFNPDPIEVAELIETPLELLLDAATVKQEEWNIRGTPVAVPFFQIYGHKVWGATAMVLSELIVLFDTASALE
jgi:8-oxo-dGTP pyrophosphatase MutT (NUDIX family)